MGRGYLFAALVVASLFAIQEILLFQRALDFGLGPEREFRERGRALVSQGIDFDLRTPLQVVRHERTRNPSVFPVVTPQHFIHHGDALHTSNGSIFPLSGISGVKTIFCNESGRYATYQSDRFGFRNPDSLHRKDKIETIALGDSFLHGACVGDSDLISQRLGGNVANFGFGRHGPLSYLAALREYGEILRPKTVLWFHYEGNDTYDLEDERKHPILRRYLERHFTQRLATRQTEIDTALKALAELELTKQSSAGFFKDWWNHRPSFQSWLTLKPLRQSFAKGTESPFSPEPLGYLRERDIIKTYEMVLAEAVETVKPWNGKIVFVYLPEWRTLQSGAMEREDKKKLIPIVAGLGIDFLDMTESFRRGNDPLRYFPYRRFGHYTAEGYALVAHEVANFLAKPPSDNIHNTGGSGTPGT